MVAWPTLARTAAMRLRRQLYHSQQSFGSRAKASGVAKSSCCNRRHKPPGPRKVATPLSAEMPAPVTRDNTTRFGDQLADWLECLWLAFYFCLLRLISSARCSEARMDSARMVMVGFCQPAVTKLAPHRPPKRFLSQYSVTNLLRTLFLGSSPMRQVPTS